MGQELVTKCDTCGIVKQSSNRWIAAKFEAESISYREMPKSNLPSEYKTFCGAPDFLRYVGKVIASELQLEAESGDDGR